MPPTSAPGPRALSIAPAIAGALAISALTTSGCGGDAVGRTGGPVKTACATWAASQHGDGAGVPAPPDATVTDQRTNLLDAGGGITAVGSKYFISYFPAGFAASPIRRVLVNLHGTGGSPEAEWTDFRADLDTRGWGYLGLKYYDDASGLYDNDETIYANLASMVGAAERGCDLEGAKLFLFGFSRGSAKTFSMAVKDRARAAGPLFTAFASSSGGAWQQPAGCAWTAGGACGWQPSSPIYPSSCALLPPTAPVCACSPLTMAAAPDMADPPTFATAVLAAANRTAYAGSRFWLYCGERDYNDGYRQCGDMEMSRAFVEAFGGHVEELYAAGPAGGCSPWTGSDCITKPDLMCGHGSLKNQATALGHMWAYFEAL